jgi:hypothetical protein
MTATEIYFSITREIDAPREAVFRAWVAQRLAPTGYRDVTIPRRLAFVMDADGSLAIVTFAEHHGGTALTFEGAGAQDVEAYWRAVLDRLADQFAGSHSRGNAGGIRPG